MNGKSDEEIKAGIEEAKKVLLDKYEGQYELEFLDTYIYETSTAKHPAVWYLGKSLQILAEADLAYFCKGWNSTRGCRIENQAAYSYDIKIIEVY